MAQGYANMAVAIEARRITGAMKGNGERGRISHVHVNIFRLVRNKKNKNKNLLSRNAGFEQPNMPTNSMCIFLVGSRNLALDYNYSGHCPPAPPMV